MLFEVIAWTLVDGAGWMDTATRIATDAPRVHLTLKRQGRQLTVSVPSRGTAVARGR